MIGEVNGPESEENWEQRALCDRDDCEAYALRHIPGTTFLLCWTHWQVWVATPEVEA